MKFKYLLFMLLTMVPFYVSAAEIDDLNFCVSTSSMWQLVGYALFVLKVLIPLLVILLAIVDLVKAIMDDDVEIADAAKALGSRLIFGIAIFFVPLLVSVALSFIKSAAPFLESMDACQTCLLNPTGEVCNDYKTEAALAREANLEEERQPNANEVTKGACYYCESEEKYVWSEKTLLNCTKQSKYTDPNSCESALPPEYNTNPGNGGTTVDDETFLQENGKDGLVEVVDGVFYVPDNIENGHEDSKGSAPYGYNIFFYNRLVKFIEAAADAGFTITMGTTEDRAWRSYERQAYFYNCYLTQSCNNGNLAATPGNSNHGWGIASDLDYDRNSEAIAWAHANAEAYGLAFPVSSENWHISPLHVVKVEE